MATTSIRTNVKSFIVEELTTAFEGTDCGVSRSWPGENLKRNHAWIDRCTGVITFGQSMADRKSRDDDFTLRIVFQAYSPGFDQEAADAAAEECYGALEDLIANDPSLDSMDGVVHALLGTVEGPDGPALPEGACSFVVAELNVKARLL